MQDRSESGRDGGATKRRRTRPALLLAIGCLLVAGSAGVALAASLGITSDRLGAGGAAVLPCDGDGFTYSFTTQGGDVMAVTVGDIADPGCEGGVVRLTLTVLLFLRTALGIALLAGLATALIALAAIPDPAARPRRRSS